MMRLTKKVFTDLSIFMMGLGLLIGVIFPFFVSWMGIPREYVMKPWFFIACVTAGIIVGALNISLARTVVGSRLKLLGNRMQYVTKNLKAIKSGDKNVTCKAEDCQISVDSEDEIGDSTIAFNSLVDTLFQSIETENSLTAFNQLLNSQIALRDLTEKALSQLLSFTGSVAGAILIENEGELNVSSSQGIKNFNSLVENDHVKNVLRNGHRTHIQLPDDVLLEGVLTDFRPHEIIIEPVLYKNVVLGLIILGNSNDYSGEAITRLSLFGQGLALALHNAILFDRLERLAALDPLTSIYNRRFGMRRLHEEYGRSLRSNAPMGMMMMDLDHFKQVNDTYGHLTGDRVLIKLSKLARSVLRDGDILVRYGGEEFLAILPGASKQDVKNIAERLRRKVEESSFTEDDISIKVTISIGAISFPEFDAANEMELVDSADQALYRAKESGRNCVMMATKN